MKIIIDVDMEGIAGVVNNSQWEESGKYYEESRDLLTEEVNAACAGAVEAGATKILVVAGHGKSPGCVMPGKLHPQALLLHGDPSPQYQELDQWDAMLLVGRHAMNGAKDACINHTFSRSIVSMTLNGSAIGEIGIVTYTAGWFKIPVVLITGDEAACKEAQQYVANIEQAPVKWGFNRTCAMTLSPLAARALIQQKAFQAVKRIHAIKPVTLKGKCELVIEFMSTSNTFSRSQRPHAQKLDERRVRFRCKNFMELIKSMN